ncbi:MAG TPA: flocculation-associated PEP-CTERM protein PepA [Ramlibacter sp.]
MKMLNKLVSAAAVAMAFAGSANAGVVMNDWVFNPIGTGFANGQTIHENLNVAGNSFIELTPKAGSNTAFSFTEHSVFNIPQADANGQLFPLNFPGGNITATFVANGTGSLGGGFTFSGGTISIYQNPVNSQYATAAGIYGANLGNLIATFQVQPGGGGQVDQFGNPIANGQVTVNAMAQAGDLMPGYFFDKTGKDLSTQKVLSFAFTNANPLQSPTALQVSEIMCEFAGYTGSGCNGTAYNPGPSNQLRTTLFLNTDGQFKLAEVPEPGSLALFGIAMLGAGVVTRKRAKKV